MLEIPLSVCLYFPVWSGNLFLSSLCSLYSPFFPMSSPTKSLFMGRQCEPCKRRKRACNGQRPCTHCVVDARQDCVYSVVTDQSRSVFTTQSARRLSSGSACETCRRRKTKCDGGSPCGFCASAGVECVNHSERRKRSLSHQHHHQQQQQQEQHQSQLAQQQPFADGENAMDRIEDRLRRIEKLMTAFTPSPLSQSMLPPEQPTVGTVAGRKLSSPPPVQAYQRLAARRPHRHSVQGITVAKEQAELRTAVAASRRGET